MAPWNDDERDTSCGMKTIHKSSNFQEVTLTEALRGYFKAEKESLITWTDKDVEHEVKKRYQKLFAYHQKPIVHYIEKPVVKQDDVEEINNDILENEIYKKCWYS